MADRKDRRGSPRIDIQLLQDMEDVIPGRTLANGQHFGDLAIAQTLGQQTQDFAFTRRQSGNN